MFHILHILMEQGKKIWNILLGKLKEIRKKISTQDVWSMFSSDKSFLLLFFSKGYLAI